VQIPSAVDLIDVHRPDRKAAISSPLVVNQSPIDANRSFTHWTAPAHTSEIHATTLSQFAISRTRPAMRAMIPTTIHVIGFASSATVVAQIGATRATNAPTRATPIRPT